MKRIFSVGFLCLALVVSTQGGLSAHEAVRKAKLRGEKEVPGPGDPDGKGKARIEVNDEAEEICFEVNFSDIGQPNAAHIHKGKAGVAGDVVVTLWSESQGSPATGCVDVNANLAEKIQKHPKRYYVNLHTDEFPNGAIRGNLKRP